MSEIFISNKKTGGKGKQYGRASLLSVSSILIALSGLK